MAFVLDCSTTMAWCFEDEGAKRANRFLERLATTHAVVPTIWALEVANVLLVAQRKRRVTVADSIRFLDLLRSLPIRTDEETTRRAWTDTLPLAARLSLSACDAAYVELAIRLNAPLATLDTHLTQAARKAGVKVL
jgi:predicted nucleic acid-binding protein